MRAPFAPRKSIKEIYREQYEAAKKGGETFFPETVARDAIVALLIVIAIVVLAIIFPVTSEAPADPTSTTYNPRPEWYFLFFFQFLKFFPGQLEPLAAAIIPMLAIMIFILIPFLGRGMGRHWSQRRLGIGLGTLVVALFIALVVGGVMSAPASPAGEASPLVQSGREVYQEVNCAYCHSISGRGGNIGPDLSAVGAQLDGGRLSTYLKDPHAMLPTTLHPKLQFTEEELDALVAYLLTLGALVSYTAEAPQLFEENCVGCHMINGQGGTLGPDLSTVGSRRSVSFLESFTADPKAVFPGTTMLTFKDMLTPEQIRDIAAYLSGLRGEAAPTPISPGVPPIPHTLEGRDDCLMCHAEGGFKPFPADHDGRTSDTCRTCHQPSP